MKQKHAPNRLNPEKWLVAYTYSFIRHGNRWRAWRPYRELAVIPTFDTAADAYEWIRKQ